MKSQGDVRMILIVDDDKRLLEAWQRVLRRTHDVFVAADVATARAIAERERLDAAVIDFWLGEVSGIELVRELRARLPSLRIALVSGYLYSGNAAEAVRAGADHVFSKPFEPREVVDALNGTATPVETPLRSLSEMQRDYVRRVLADCGGNVSAAARVLRIERSTLRRKLRRRSRTRRG